MGIEMDIDFIKMHGAGNDYVYIDLIKNNYSVDYNDLARRIADRHFGVGGDGLVLIMNSDKADFRMRMFNLDGSEAEMCGNAIRCVAKYLFDNGYKEDDKVSIETLAGIKTLEIIERDKDGHALKLRVNMGRPVLKGSEIPVKVDKEPVIGLEIMGYRGTAVSMGNPHIVFFVDEITDKMVLEDGPKIEVNELFPKKVNVEFARIIDRENIQMRVWERGSGETLACGTGACATGVAAILNSLTDRKVNIHALGGELTVEWDEKTGDVFLSGPAEEVFRGVYYYKGI